MENIKFENQEQDNLLEIASKPKKSIYKGSYKQLDRNIKTIKKSKDTKYKKWVD